VKIAALTIDFLSVEPVNSDYLYEKGFLNKLHLVVSFKIL